MSGATNTPSIDDVVKLVTYATVNAGSDFARISGVANAAYVAGYAAAEAQRPAAPDAQAAADAELEACFDFLEKDGCYNLASRLRAARRPPAPSARDAAIAALRRAKPMGSADGLLYTMSYKDYEAALRALESGDGQ